MSTGTMQLSGFVTAGAARPGACAALPTTATIAAPAAATYVTPATQGQHGEWLHGSNGKPVSPVFDDRPTRRPLERFP
ncbi:MAG TPA: hypothetical protein VFI47_27990 [Acidimicrobiales bacterium]|nr:hypothetical protein [Acidimicrobiales bacterium]